MSEMKPVGWLYEIKVPETNIWINAATAYEPIAETDRRRNVQPVYTAAQLAEAVAAEREWCAKVCRSLADKEFGDDNKSDAITALMCAEAIRSAAK